MNSVDPLVIPGISHKHGISMEINRPVKVDIPIWSRAEGNTLSGGVEQGLERDAPVTMHLDLCLCRHCEQHETEGNERLFHCFVFLKVDHLFLICYRKLTVILITVGKSEGDDVVARVGDVELHSIRGSYRKVFYSTS